MTGLRAVLAVVAIALWTPQAAEAGSRDTSATHAAAGAASDVSAQTRRDRQRGPARIEVRPLRRSGPIFRECIPVFQERWIPQWGGRVLYAGKHCWWQRG